MNSMYLDYLLEDIIRENERNAGKRALAVYRSALKWLRMCYGPRIRLSTVDHTWVQNFRDFLLINDLDIRYINGYSNAVCASYVRALTNLGIKSINNPFESFLPVENLDSIHSNTIQLIRNKKLEGGQRLILSRDLFLFSYHGLGLSFREMAYLEQSNILSNQLRFLSKKTGRERVINLNVPMKAILLKWDKGNQYVFPIIVRSDRNVYHQYYTGLQTFKRNLFKLSEVLGVDKESISLTVKLEV
jgi:hypothetical protein